MPRPRSPRISRESTVQAALRIIDAEGLDALSLPRLAREMNVRAPSLYHHFADKDEILAAVARTVVEQTVVPRRPPTPDWPGWFTRLALNFRTAVLRHRNAAPLLLQHMPRQTLTDVFERAAAYLHECGVPPHLHVPILDGLEKLAIGATVAEAVRPPARRRTGYEHADPALHATLAAAVRANDRTARQLFEQTVRCHLAGVQQLVDADSWPNHPARPPGKTEPVRHRSRTTGSGRTPADPQEPR